VGGFVGMDSEGMSGGLAIYWHESLQVDVKEVSARYIDDVVQTFDDAPQSRIACVYGEPRVEN
jgi:hypothetical protein